MKPRHAIDFGVILRKVAAEHADAPAVWFEGREQSYAEMYARACRLANALRGLGVEPGDRVALLGANGFETVEQTAGLALANVTRAALYAHQTPAVNADLLEMIGARALIVQADQHGPLAEVADVEHVIVYDGDAPPGTHGYEALLAAADDADPRVPVDPDDLHVIRFSAGTTGRPKGVVHTVAGWLAGCTEYRWATPQLDERDRYLAAGPLTHAAVIFLWQALQVGACVVPMPAFEPGRALELIEQRRITLTLMVPTMIQAMVNHPDARTRDLSSLRCLNYAASPITEATLTAAVDLLGEDVLYQLYAQSEAWPITMLQPHQQRPRGTERERRWLRSVGRATPNTQITIVDDDGNPLPIGEVGEIAARTPGLMVELWNEPEATAERTLPDGSLLTRDVGSLDEDGFLYLADRKEDMIISGGYNIWPAELENALASHPAVAEAAVVGVPHERWGETPHAVVVLRADAAATARELIDWTRDQVGSVKKVTSVAFAAELPKSAIGKVLRRELRDAHWQGSDRQVGGA